MAAKLEPDDQHILAQLSKARSFEAREEAEGRHKFKRKHDAAAGGGGGNKEPPQKKAAGGGKQQKKTLLSFEQDEGEEQG